MHIFYFRCLRTVNTVNRGKHSSCSFILIICICCEYRVTPNVDLKIIDHRPNHNRGWILASTHSPAFHGCIPTPNTVVVMVDALLNVKFLLVREHQIGQHAIFHEIQKVSTSFDPHSFTHGCELLALLHLVGALL